MMAKPSATRWTRRRGAEGVDDEDHSPAQFVVPGGQAGDARRDHEVDLRVFLGELLHGVRGAARAEVA